MQNWLQYVQNGQSQSHFKKADSSYGINEYRIKNTVEDAVRQMNETRNNQQPRQQINEAHDSPYGDRI
jgi:hypothetical protein